MVNKASFIGFVLFALSFSTLSQAFERDYSKFSPKFEGTFEVELTCQPQDPSPVCKNISKVTSMRVFNTYSDVVVTFFSKSATAGGTGLPTENEPDAFLATGFEKDGESLFANAYQTSLSHPARELVLEYSEGEKGKIVTGWMRDTKTRYDIRVKGTQVSSPASWYESRQNSNPISPATIVGDFKGIRTDGTSVKKFALSIRKSAIGSNLMASLFSSDNSESVTDYVVSQIFPENGVFVLVARKGFNSKVGFSKLVLGVTEGIDGKVTFNGISFATDKEQYYDFRFSNTDEPVVVDPPQPKEPKSPKVSISMGALNFLQGGEPNWYTANIRVKNISTETLPYVRIVITLPDGLEHRKGKVVFTDFHNIAPNEIMSSHVNVAINTSGTVTVKIEVLGETDQEVFGERKVSYDLP